MNIIKRWFESRNRRKEFNILCKYFPPRKVAQMMISHSYGVTPIECNTIPNNEIDALNHLFSIELNIEMKENEK